MTEVVTVASSERTLPELVGWVRQEGLALNLSNERLAFLIAISALSRDDDSHELTEPALHDAFGYVSQIFGQMDETLSHRANNAINEFVRQKLLSRFNADPVEGGESISSDPACSEHCRVLCGAKRGQQYQVVTAAGAGRR